MATTLKERQEKLIHEIKSLIISSDKTEGDKKSLMAVVDSFRGSYLELEKLHEELLSEDSE